MYRFAAGPGLVGSERVIGNVSRLADYGLVFELQVFAHQAPAALRLVDTCPRVRFVLQHALMPEDLSEEGVARWRKAMAQMASRANVFCKLSAFGTFLRRNDPAHIARTVAESVATFGAERCLYGSNFRIEKLWTDYRPLFGAFEAATAALPKSSRDEIFAGTGGAPLPAGLTSARAIERGQARPKARAFRLPAE